MTSGVASFCCCSVDHLLDPRIFSIPLGLLVSGLPCPSLAEPEQPPNPSFRRSGSASPGKPFRHRSNPFPYPVTSSSSLSLALAFTCFCSAGSSA